MRRAGARPTAGSFWSSSGARCRARGEVPSRSLLRAAQEPAYALWALSPYEKMDALKAHGYRWDAERRC